MSIIKKLASMLLTIVIIAAVFPGALDAHAGLDNYTYSGQFRPGQFRDVDQRHWFAKYVEDAFNYGLMKGRSANSFVPGGHLTLGEAITLAARLRSIYHTGSSAFPTTVPYYEPYVEYAVLHGILDGEGAENENSGGNAGGAGIGGSVNYADDYSIPVTRAMFAKLMHNALPHEAFMEINSISDFTICDVAPTSDYGAAVYSLYRAGIISGSDQFGTFYPERNITRAEACAIIVRIADPNMRLRVKLPDSLPAEVIYSRSVNAVVSIETFDDEGNLIRTGSGFFINNAGHIITALHVINNAASVSVTLLGGATYDAAGIISMSEEYNIVLLAVESDGGGFSSLVIADSDLVEAGNTVYALGNPLNYVNTISDGVVAHTNRVLGDETFIMFTAPISFGSGGGPVLNSRGQVIAIASSSFTHGQNINLAIPINFIHTLS